MTLRGKNKKVVSSFDVENFLKWLDLQETNSVIYICLGSICKLTSLQFIEIGIALEACERPFIWVIRERNQTKELNQWIKESSFEERTKQKVLRVGVMVGMESPVNWGDEENVGMLVKKEDIERAIEKLIDGASYESEERIKRGKELAEMAKRSVEGGFSLLNVTLLIQDILQLSTK
ncbi:hypothetical protein KIW84_031527 [Lathyrus oleraceus]|uniref:Uncharacterized protein n=1 Tax=Pisum sativum TaxID=3888 RepID=A0A9D5AVC4_PEA|nr:hypothetical protein KIW84_031527 [Pisum sativum]